MRELKAPHGLLDLGPTSTRDEEISTIQFY